MCFIDMDIYAINLDFITPEKISLELPPRNYPIFLMLFQIRRIIMIMVYDIG